MLQRIGVAPSGEALLSGTDTADFRTATTERPCPISLSGSSRTPRTAADDATCESWGPQRPAGSSAHDLLRTVKYLRVSQRE